MFAREFFVGKTCRWLFVAVAMTALGTIAFGLTSKDSLAINASPHPVRVTQPDGTEIVLTIHGDEGFRWEEDADGYTVLLNNGRYVYADRGPNGLLVPTGLEVGKTDPLTQGMEKRILPAQAMITQMRANTPRVASGDTQGAPERFAASGLINNLVIPIRFSNHTTRTVPSEADLDVLFNNVGPDALLAPTGSVRDVYLRNSYGAMDLVSTIADWVTLSSTEQFYADRSSGLVSTVWQAVIEALNAVDPFIDFSQFDQDNDGFIDAIAFVHSGYGAEWGGTDADGTFYTNRIWSHKWHIPTWTSAEGIKVSAYHISPALWGTSGASIGRIGVIAHETGHFFGLPDLYDTNGGGQGIGSYGLMANAWGFDGSQLYPPHFSPWSKVELGWITPTVLSLPGAYSLEASEDLAEYFRIDAGYPNGEYLLIENRQPSGFDADMPQGGLAIWHIDDLAAYSAEGFPGQIAGGFPWPENGLHYRVALLQADGNYDLEKGTNLGDSGDVWHGVGVSEINGLTSPGLDAYQGGFILDSGNRISGISLAGATMTFDYENGAVPATAPDVVGLTRAAAETAITGAGLTIGAISMANDPTVPAGDVISQNPAALTLVALGSAVDLVISLGPAPPSVAAPDVVGLTQAAAETAISGAGLTVGVVSTANDATVPLGDVISQNPAALALVALGSAVDLVISLGPTPPVAVPDVVGLGQAAAYAAITVAGLTVGVVTTANSDTVPRGAMISQNPAALTLVAPGSAVDLVVSIGPGSVSTPDVVGLTQAAAETAITGAGLVVGTIDTSNDAKVPAGNVIGQTPAASTLVALGSGVDLVISLGPASVTTPDVVGLTRAAAETAITGTGLTVGTIDTANDATVPVGHVIGQTPAASTLVALGSVVDLVISLGPAPVATPDVVGLTRAAAETAIAAAGLALGTVTTVQSATAPAGHVISQTPAASTLVAPGSGVDLVISLGSAPVATPNVVGLTQAAAATAIAGVGLTVGTIGKANSATAPAGIVIGQTPAASTLVALGSAVDLILSLGPAPVATPDVVGLSRATAETAITAAGLALGTVTTVRSISVPAGNVIGQIPAASTLVAPGSAVDLVISLGPTPVEVPDVVEKTRAAAEAAIILAGLKVGTIGRAKYDEAPAGEVIGQTPGAEIFVPLGSAVDLVFSLGPAPVATPALGGLALAAAETAIDDAGLEIGTINTANSATVPVEAVIGQTPAALTLVAPDSAVDLIISLGPPPVPTPNVTGLTQTAAETAITGAGLTVGTIDTANDATTPAGNVIGQTPTALTSTMLGGAVDLIVSLGPPPVAVPEVVEKTRAAAETAIDGAGLTVGTIGTANDAAAPAGVVISQTPAAEVLVAPGSAVDLVVSLGPGTTAVNLNEVKRDAQN